MRYLVISDIHGNWEALTAVLETAHGAYERLICCGDFVGYGADPNAVIDWARENVQAAVRGNHDRACVGLEELEWFNPSARAASLWTQRELTAENATYVRTLPKGPVEENGFEIHHGSPLDEDDYLVTVAEATEAFASVDCELIFFGHTHLQGGFRWKRQRAHRMDPMAGTGEAILELESDAAYMVNPGSVGQPRDGDPRTAYVLYDSKARVVTYRRVPYDIELAARKIVEAGLPDALAARLEVGR